MEVAVNVEQWEWFMWMMLSVLGSCSICAVLFGWLAMRTDSKRKKELDDLRAKLHCLAVPAVVWFGLEADLWLYVGLVLFALGAFIYAFRMTAQDKRMVEAEEAAKVPMPMPEEECGLTYYQIRNGKCADGEVFHGKIHCKKCKRTF